MFKNKKMTVATVLLLSLGAVGSANAALPAEATDALTAVSADGVALIAAGWPVLVAITGGIIIMKLFKRVVNKAT